jgi:hypothetical protein
VTVNPVGAAPVVEVLVVGVDDEVVDDVVDDDVVDEDVADDASVPSFAWRLSSHEPAGMTRESSASNASQAIRPDAADVTAARWACVVACAAVGTAAAACARAT